MPIKRTGTVVPITDKQTGRVVGYRGRLRLADGSRPWLRVPDDKVYSEARAREWVAAMQEQEDAKGKLLAKRRAQAKPDVDGAAAGDRWFEAWERSRVAKGLTSTRDNRGHYEHHIRPALAGKHVRDWTAEDLRALVAALDTKVERDEMSAKSAANVWRTATKMCSDAVGSKVEALRVRKDNPAADVEGPETGDEREKQFLYPSELLRVVSCDDIPLRWRRAIALAVYLFPRAGELRALRWEDVDLEHGTVHVHRAFERRTRTTKSTKSGKGRRFAIEPMILPLLEAIHAESGGEGLVMDLPNRLASRLREWLPLAGVTRRELLDEKSKTTKPLAFHDLRATGLTWMAVRGDEPLKIMQRAGHTDFATTQIYVRTAEAVRDGFGEPFPALPTSLLRSTASVYVPNSVVISERDTGFESVANVASRENKPPRVEVVSDERRAETSNDATTRRGGPSGPNVETEPNDGGAVLRKAIADALAIGNDALAGELMDLLRRRGDPDARPAKVISIDARRTKAGT